MQLMDGMPPATNDLDELKLIHRYLFQDVYEWAGELRIVDLRKNVLGAEFFLPVSMIEHAAAYAAQELRDDNLLRGMGRDKFVERIAYHYDQFNTCTRSVRAMVVRNECSGTEPRENPVGNSIGVGFREPQTMRPVEPLPIEATSNP